MEFFRQLWYVYVLGFFGTLRVLYYNFLLTIHEKRDKGV